MLFWMARSAARGASRNPEGCGVVLLLFGVLAVLGGIARAAAAVSDWSPVLLVVGSIVVVFGALAGLSLWLEKRDRR